MAATGDADAPATSHAVRGASAVAATLVNDGIRRSTTVRSLAAELDQSDVLVFVDIVFDAPSMAGRTVMVSNGGTHRILRVFVNARLDGARRLEILGHELTHCAEIARASSVRSANDLKGLERAIGWRAGSAEAFETTAARAAELRVRGEIRENQ
jgi:hypothetical protein